MKSTVFRVLFLFLAMGLFQHVMAYDKLLQNTSWKGSWRGHLTPIYQSWWHTSGDTILNGKLYSIVQYTDTQFRKLSVATEQYYLREDTMLRKVFILDTSLNYDHVWYDFGLGVGDTAIHASEAMWTSGWTTYICTGIDTIQTDWGARRRLIFGSSSLIEGIGWEDGEDLRGLLFVGTWSWFNFETACIYKNKVQQWLNPDPFEIISTPCESMCPSVGTEDSLSVYHTTICPGDSLILTGPCDSASYWTTLNNPGMVLDSSSSILVSPSNTTTYLWHGLLKTDTVEVIVRTPLSLDLGADTALCANKIYTITPNVSDSLVNYTWSNNSTGRILKVGLSGVYWLEVVDLWNCFKDSDTMNYVALPVPQVSMDSLIIVGLKDPPLLLYSGLPAGGVYYGKGVSNSFFYPAVAGNGRHEISYVVIASNSCTDTAHGIIEVSDYTGIAGTTSFTFPRIYPNPANTHFYIETTSEKEYIELLDQSGRIIESVWLHKGINTVDLTSYSKGLYFIRTNNGVQKLSKL